MKQAKYWTIDGWYEFDINVYNFHEQIVDNPYFRSKLKKYLEGIQLLIRELTDRQLCDSWFFLFEGRYIRIRIKSDQKELCTRIINGYFDKTIFPRRKIRSYREERWKFDCAKSVELFAQCMNAISEMCIGKINSDINFDPYRMYERLCHCIHVNLFGHANEIEILIKRLSERLSQRDHTSIYEKFLRNE